MIPLTLLCVPLGAKRIARSWSRTWSGCRAAFYSPFSSRRRRRQVIHHSFTRGPRRVRTRALGRTSILGLHPHEAGGQLVLPRQGRPRLGDLRVCKARRASRERSTAHNSGSKAAAEGQGGRIPVAVTDSMTFSRVARDWRRERWLSSFGCSETMEAKKLSLDVSMARFSRPVFPCCVCSISHGTSSYMSLGDSRRDRHLQYPRYTTQGRPGEARR